MKRYHQATSWGLTSETVVHHGPLPDFLVEPVLELVDDRRIDLGALARGAVGRGIGPAGEAVGLERRVRVRVQVPLAPPRRLVVQVSQQRAPRREAAAQPAAAGDHAAGLVRVQAGQQRAARGRAVVGRGVVTFEADRLAAQRRDVRQQRVERERCRHPRRRAQLVDEDHEDVRRPVERRTAPASADAAAPRAPGLRRRGRAARGQRQRAAGEQPTLDERAAVAVHVDEPIGHAYRDCQQPGAPGGAVSRQNVEIVFRSMEPERDERNDQSRARRAAGGPQHRFPAAEPVHARADRRAVRCDRADRGRSAPRPAHPRRGARRQRRRRRAPVRRALSRAGGGAVAGAARR